MLKFTSYKQRHTDTDIFEGREDPESDDDEEINSIPTLNNHEKNSTMTTLQNKILKVETT